jgi:5-methylcytosine-specific restriction endonuclease McrA
VELLMANSEYRKYHASTKMKKERAQRNRNRRVMERAGRVKKGDGREVDHKKPMSKGGGNGRKNLRVVSRSVNRKKHNKTGK